MQQLVSSKWPVWLCGVGAVLLQASLLCANDVPERFPTIPPVSFGDKTDLADGQIVLRERVRRLSALAEKTDDALLRAELRMAAANIILAQQLELPCTRVFWGVAEPDGDHPASEEHRQSLAAAEKLLTHAKDDLDTARQALVNHPPVVSEEDEGGPVEAEKNSDRDDLRKRFSKDSGHRRTLMAFHRALHTALLPPTGEGAARESRRAASELSALMENDNPRVAMAANFWQAYLRKAEPDAKATLSRLSYALDEVAAADQPYAFFSRVLRGMVLADHGRHFAAITLFAQMEERALIWFGDDEARDRAVRAIVWVRVRLLQQWHERLNPDTQREEREWCRERASQLIQRSLSEPNLLPRLSPAIPMLFDPDGLENAAADSP